MMMKFAFLYQPTGSLELLKKNLQWYPSRSKQRDSLLICRDDDVVQLMTNGVNVDISMYPCIFTILMKACM
jgi:hypothetical protein